MLENVIKTQNVELQKVKGSISVSDKEIKINAKELNKVNVKCENLEENFQKSKQENKTLKNKIKVLEKDLSKLEKNIKENVKKNKTSDLENNTNGGNKSAASNTKVCEEKSLSSIRIPSFDRTSPVIQLATPPNYSKLEAPSSSSTSCSIEPIISKASLSPISSPVPTLDLLPIPPKGFVVPRTTSLTSYNSSSPQTCSHDQQCVLRQPFPPPIPAMTPLVNNRSKYHEKMIAGTLDYGRTCEYCMRIEYERYGCDSCVWIKCFGELHGYPDIDPYQYHQYR